MHNNLLKKPLSILIAAAMLTACGSEEGYDAKFNAANAIELKDGGISAEMNESSGLQYVDLLANANVNGKPLSQYSGTVLLRNFEFGGAEDLLPPQKEGLSDNQDISPFVIKNNRLEVDTDAFADILRRCETSELNPASFTYQISYNIDNGFDYDGDAPLQTLNLTLNAVDDPLEGVMINTNDVPRIDVAAGGTMQATATPVPFYACDYIFEWRIEDESLATVDENGLITGIKPGTTNITVTARSDEESTRRFSHTVSLKVVEAPVNVASINIQNNAQVRQMPTCSATPFKVIPQAQTDTQIGGTFVYDWSANDASVELVNTLQLSNFSEIGYFRTETLDSGVTDKQVNVSLATVEDAQASFEVVDNLACNTKNLDPRYVDMSFDDNTQFNNNVRWWFLPGYAATNLKADGIAGNAIAYTLPDGYTGEVGMYYSTYQKGPTGNSYFAAQFGIAKPQAEGGSWGLEFKAGMWVKVVRADPSNTDEVTLRHHLLAWETSDVKGSEARAARRANGPEFVAKVSPGEWQYVEFKDQLWDDNPDTTADSFTIPETWADMNSGGDIAVLPEFLLEGMTPGDRIFFDDYTVVEVK
ncbi:Ig-like domain-containing protein [Gayadomonas joobiniege]|uniref:Ig-like domain-containing protein n=1 Tax=Gayadomonas joobiniege TaxID=1234606 RepID=UPI000373E516|nr:Ig-like domain-containing protein [Gayadomonas joobiniege]